MPWIKNAQGEWVNTGPMMALPRLTRRRHRDEHERFRAACTAPVILESAKPDIGSRRLGAIFPSGTTEER